jgi:hypothetical protein
MPEAIDNRPGTGNSASFRQQRAVDVQEDADEVIDQYWTRYRSRSH